MFLCTRCPSFCHIMYNFLPRLRQLKFMKSDKNLSQSISAIKISLCYSPVWRVCKKNVEPLLRFDMEEQTHFRILLVFLLFNNNLLVDIRQNNIA